jgi:hypothetical protein
MNISVVAMLMRRVVSKLSTIEIETTLLYRKHEVCGSMGP